MRKHKTTYDAQYKWKPKSNKLKHLQLANYKQNLKEAGYQNIFHSL